MRRLLKPPYPLRVWMIAGIVGLVVIPYLLTVLVILGFLAFEPPSSDEAAPTPRFSTVDSDDTFHLVESQPDRWADPAWREQVGEQLRQLGLRVFLQTTANGVTYALPDSAPTAEEPVREVLVQSGGSVVGKATWLAAPDPSVAEPESALPDQAKLIIAEVESQPGRWDDPAWRSALATRLKEFRLQLQLRRPGGNGFTLPHYEAEHVQFGPYRFGYTLNLRRERDAAVYQNGQWAGDIVWFTVVPETDIARKRYNAVMSTVMPYVVGGLIIGTIWLAIHLAYRSILGPLSTLSHASRQINRGELEFAIPTSPVREVNEFARAFDQMRQGLKESITRQAAMEQERRLFIAALAHDLRTPLTSVRGYLEGLRDGVAATPEKISRYVAVALEKTESLTRLIESLFAFARSEYLEQPPKKERLDLAQTLQAAAEAMLPRAKAKSIHLELRGPQEPIDINADPLMLSRVLDNLLENAIRHTPEGGTINLGCAANRFWVHDSGPGIPADDLPHIFDPLYRGDKSRGTRTEGGAGLGLAIAKRLVDAHGGTISAANDAGARFTVTLP